MPETRINLDQNGHTAENLARLNKMKEIGALERNEREGARIRAKEEKLKYDDRPTKYFLRKKKPNRGEAVGG